MATPRTGPVHANSFALRPVPLDAARRSPVLDALDVLLTRAVHRFGLLNDINGWDVLDLLDSTFRLVRQRDQLVQRAGKFLRQLTTRVDGYR